MLEEVEWRPGHLEDRSPFNETVLPTDEEGGIFDYVRKNEDEVVYGMASNKSHSKNMGSGQNLESSSRPKNSKGH